MTSVIAAGAAGVLGLLFGSFANVVVHRAPEKKSIVSPPSACPHCGHQIRRRHNVPVLGWLWLRGRCYDCQAPVSARYPLVELFMGLAFAGITAAVGVTWALPLLLVLAFFTIALSAIDVATYRLPNNVMLPFAIAAVITIPFVATSWPDAGRVGLAALALGAFYFFAFIIYPRGMGWGDVKLAVILGAVLGAFGWQELIVGGFAAFVWGALVGMATMVVRKQRKGVKIPFGPWMFAGAWTGIFAGPWLVNWYLNTMGLA